MRYLILLLLVGILSAQEQPVNHRDHLLCPGVGAHVDPFRGGVHGRLWYRNLFGGQFRFYGDWKHNGMGILLEAMAKAPIEFPVKPYATVGIGYHWQHIDTTLNTLPFDEWIGMRTFRIAGGGEYHFGPKKRHSVSAELGYFRGSADYSRSVTEIGEEGEHGDTAAYTIHPLALSVLYTYYFCGGEEVLDSDGDGIPDTEDKCKRRPEDKDGFQDEDGCPEKDNDGDGIVDAEDKCPLAPEDEEGFQDEDGCPDFDNDNDRIPDSVDICIDIPETHNGYQDEDGCPDEAPEEVKKPLVLEGVNFESGSDVITKGSFPILDKVAESFLAWEDVHIEIQGHTDNVGSEQANMTLSKKRAISIMNYLVKKGIAPERLTAVGYGESVPIADNKTTAGRAKNRRVELKRKN